MELDIRNMAGKAHCYADNYLADHLPKWCALRKAYADGYKEASNDIQERAKAESINENSGLHKHVVNGSACKSHKIKELPYLAWQEWAEKQHKKGINQYKCSKCKRWLFPTEI